MSRIQYLIVSGVKFYSYTKHKMYPVWLFYLMGLLLLSIYKTKNIDPINLLKSLYSSDNALI